MPITLQEPSPGQSDSLITGANICYGNLPIAIGTSIGLRSWVVITCTHFESEVLWCWCLIKKIDFFSVLPDIKPSKKQKKWELRGTEIVHWAVARGVRAW